MTKPQLHQTVLLATPLQIHSAGSYRLANDFARLLALGQFNSMIIFSQARCTFLCKMSQRPFDVVVLFFRKNLQSISFSFTVHKMLIFKSIKNRISSFTFHCVIFNVLTQQYTELFYCLVYLHTEYLLPPRKFLGEQQQKLKIVNFISQRVGEATIWRLYLPDQLDSAISVAREQIHWQVEVNSPNVNRIGVIRSRDVLCVRTDAAILTDTLHGSEIF